MKTALLYPPRQRGRILAAFGAALALHFAAIAVAHVQRGEKAVAPPATTVVAEAAFEDSPPAVDPPADDPIPLPATTPNNDSVPEERPTPPPVRQDLRKPVTPLSKRNHTSPGLATWSSAKALAVNAPRPEYPYEARRQKATGDGIVAMTVDPVTGYVRAVSMAKSTGNPFLDNAALNAFRRWRFKPGTVSSLACPITFTLVGASY